MKFAVACWISLIRRSLSRRKSFCRSMVTLRLLNRSCHCANLYLWSINLAKRNSDYNVMYFGKIIEFWILQPYAIGPFYWSSSNYPVSSIYLELTVINSVVCSQIKDLQDYILRPRLLRRMKEDVEKSIPLKEEVDLLLQDIKDTLFFSVLELHLYQIIQVMLNQINRITLFFFTGNLIP